MRIVIKVGTQVISGENGLKKDRIARIVGEIAGLMKLGHEITLVSSGAIGAGLSRVNFSGEGRKKAAAAVGQPLLMREYVREAEKRGIVAGQVLILSDDFTDRRHFRSFVENMNAMLSHGILPVINENDVMKREDLRVNDNDMLSARVASGLRADKLGILTNQTGLYTKDPDLYGDAVLVKDVPRVTSGILALCSDGKSALGVGGMIAKVKAAGYATRRGVETLIGSGDKKGTISKAVNGGFPGTRFYADERKS